MPNKPSITIMGKMTDMGKRLIMGRYLIMGKPQIIANHLIMARCLILVMGITHLIIIRDGIIIGTIGPGTISSGILGKAQSGRMYGTNRHRRISRY